MFGLLSILKNIAYKNPYASYEYFSRIKIHLIHAYDTRVRHWSMTSPKQGIYIMTREQTAKIPVTLSDMAENLLP
ncbi:hypothetical protein INT45_008623 [Circinella minor]|uniref:Uncharacterized protein n=1 Tax=Circinella minor TaxID=1195481 RepID=A0A8H7S1E4_9FUNG|nr:hypothetical protein INT45_008623 [Circinella minor]